jgi:hypothetical protein
MDIPRNQFGFPDTDERVPSHTSDETNAEIRERTLRNLRRFVGASKPAIDARIAELRREWDIERVLGMNAAAVSLVGIGLGVGIDRRYLVIPALVAGFLFQHSIQGWCPPLPMFRKLGVRTSAEIHAEILALRILRDDFNTRARGADAALSLALSKV